MAYNKIQNTNLASEFFVASQLFRRGYTVTVTFGHTKEIDLIVTNDKGKAITVDVKGLKNKTNWPLSPKSIKKSHFFILVSYLDQFDDLTVQPEVFIIPSTDIKKILGRWSGNPKVTAIGYRSVKDSKYKDAWSLLFK